MRGKVTKTSVERIKPSTRDQFLWDSEVKGFGTKVTPKGRRVYLVQYWKDGRTRRVTIGEHGIFTADEARRRAVSLKGRLADGHDPALEKRHAKMASVRSRVFDDVMREFIERDQKPRNRTWRQVERRLENHVLPRWSGLELDQISRLHVIDLLDALDGEGLSGGANRVLAAIRRLFNWSVEVGIMENSPAVGVKPRQREKERERVLSNDEVRSILLTSRDTGGPFGAFFQILLLTGQRRSEVANMTWSDLDLDAAVWNLPGDATKAGRTHQVPLSDDALRILASTSRGKRGDYVLSTTGGKSPISGFSKSKAKLVRDSADK
jgi:integrase